MEILGGGMKLERYEYNVKNKEGEICDVVSFDIDLTEDEVKKLLINHRRYSSDISVERKNNV